MNNYDIIPTVIFGVPITLSPEDGVNQIPIMYSRMFDIRRAHLDAPFDKEFCIAASRVSPEINQARKVSELLEKTTGLPCVICSPELKFWQKETLVKDGISFIQNERNLFIPFLGTQSYQPIKETNPKPLSPQAQRIMINLISGRWLNNTASDLSRRTGKSPASVTKYLSEIAAISPSLIEIDGRKRILRNTGFTKEEVFEKFESYMTSPVLRTFKIAAPHDLPLFSELGFLLAGFSALEGKTDLAFRDEDLTFMTTEEHLAAVKTKHPSYFDELPYWHDYGIQIQVWSYPVDEPDPRTLITEHDSENAPFQGIRSVDDFSLYLSLRHEIDYSDVRVADALEQVRRDACR